MDVNGVSCGCADVDESEEDFFILFYHNWFGVRKCAAVYGVEIVVHAVGGWGRRYAFDWVCGVLAIRKYFPFIEKKCIFFVIGFLIYICDGWVIFILLVIFFFWFNDKCAG